MCGIVGLFLKDKALEPELGALLSECWSRSPIADRTAPASPSMAAGKKQSKITIQSADPARDFKGLEGTRRGSAPRSTSSSSRPTPSSRSRRPGSTKPATRSWSCAPPTASWASATSSNLQGSRPAGSGRGPFRASENAGTHGIGHTRMATESAVTTMGAHPFSTGPTSASCTTARCPTITMSGAN